MKELASEVHSNALGAMIRWAIEKSSLPLEHNALSLRVFQCANSCRRGWMRTPPATGTSRHRQRMRRHDGPTRKMKKWLPLVFGIGADAFIATHHARRQQTTLRRAMLSDMEMMSLLNVANYCLDGGGRGEDDDDDEDGNDA